MTTLRGRSFSPEELDVMRDFVETLISSGMQASQSVRTGVARDYAEEVIDFLVDAKIDLDLLKEGMKGGAS